MTVASDAQEAWWPPTFRPSRLGRRWLAWWIVQDESHSTLRSSSRSRRRRCTGAKVVMEPAIRPRPGKILAFGPDFPLYRAESSHFVRIDAMITLDGIDRRILERLQQDGRLSNAELAEKVGLSSSPCWRRVKALEEAGVIKG